jgi:prepilin-type N-terminal cleavage/methylation domain-containing protein
MKKYLIFSKKGFTLTEMMMVSIIFSFFLLGIYTILDSGIKLWNLGKTRTDVQNSGIIVIRRIVRELSTSTRKTLTIDPDGEYIGMATPMKNGEVKCNQLNLSYPCWQGNIIYYFNNNKLYRHYIEYLQMSTVPLPVTDIASAILPPTEPQNNHKVVSDNIDKFNVTMDGFIVNIKMVYKKSGAIIENQKNSNYSVTDTTSNKGIETFELQAAVEPKN